VKTKAPLRRGRLAGFSATLGLLVSQGACLEIGTGTDAGTDAGAATATTTTGGVTATVTPSGTGCTEDMVTQVTLCEEISTCPGVDVDQGVFPGCGFRIQQGSPALDLECLCDTSLCPIGVPSTCAEATQLLSQQSSITVCEQIDENRCVALPTTGTTGGTSSTCDKNCESGCAGDPTCVQFCGC
jgi:hypothetical protein